MDPDLFKTFAEEFVTEVNRVRNEGSAGSDAARSELSRLENQIDKLVMAIANGADAIPLNTKIKELESRRHNLQVKVINAADAEPLIHPNLAEIYRAKIENLAALLYDPKCQAEAFDILRYLVDEARLIPDTGQLRIELKGELAGILSLCDTKQKPATSYEERAE